MNCRREHVDSSLVFFPLFYVFHFFSDAWTKWVQFRQIKLYIKTWINNPQNQNQIWNHNRTLHLPPPFILSSFFFYPSSPNNTLHMILLSPSLSVGKKISNHNNNKFGSQRNKKNKIKTHLDLNHVTRGGGTLSSGTSDFMVARHWRNAAKSRFENACQSI